MAAQWLGLIWERRHRGSGLVESAFGRIDSLFGDATFQSRSDGRLQLLPSAGSELGQDGGVEMRPLLREDFAGPGHVGERQLLRLFCVGWFPAIRLVPATLWLFARLVCPWPKGARGGLGCSRWASAACLVMGNISSERPTSVVVGVWLKERGLQSPSAVLPA